MLPTEQQWQRAAQGDDGRTYPWGAKFDKSRCNFHTKSPTPVTQYPNGESPFHVLDMSGNVWEWCSTNWETGADVLSGTDVRGVRGGSWFDDVGLLRAANRYWNFPTYELYNIGFRCARSL